ncbi:invasion associated locus B family protein [Breoghania sp. L-A4]|uniref:invasion associated locus B family protein n=1 Tax=Breoghania sp. L-A4 TaxID=2304600 RepID=UPI0020BE64C9|nr:invasion associated locus B family protein [Breoghania sp. L-A4]
MAILALAFSGAAANAQSPTLLNQFKDWAAYAHSGQNGKFCYALSKPTTLSPTDRNHGDVFFFVSTRPNEGVSNEPSLLVGYPFKENSSVSVDVDGQKFEMFTKGDGAWVKNAADEARLVSAMRAGRAMKVSGESSRGTATSYTYSLAGITAAVNAASEACK